MSARVGLASAVIELSAYFLERLNLESQSEEFMREIEQCEEGSSEVYDVICKYLDIINEHIHVGVDE